MAIDPERCLQCKTREDSGARWVPDTRLWFCSSECYEKAINEYLPRQYRRDGNPDEDDPRLKDALRQHRESLENDVDAWYRYKQWPEERFIEWAKTRPSYEPYLSARKQWEQEQETAIDGAHEKVRRHYQAEWKHDMEQAELQSVKRMEESVKRMDKDIAELEKTYDDAQKFLDDFEAEEERDKVEEERWRPKPFKV